MTVSKGIREARKEEIERQKRQLPDLLWTKPLRVSDVSEWMGFGCDKGARHTLTELKRSGLIVDLGVGNVRYWVACGSPAEAKVLAQKQKLKQAEIERRRERDRGRKSANMREARRRLEEQREAAWHYPVKRVVSEWTTTMPPRAVRTVFELAGQATASATAKGLGTTSSESSVDHIHRPRPAARQRPRQKHKVGPALHAG